MIIPQWPAPDNVKALATEREVSAAGLGHSLSPYHSLNLGDHVNDHPNCVTHNRQLLLDYAQGCQEIRWLQQVHGTDCPDAHLVENSIKYAIAPMENGGTISLIAKKEGDRLKITLSDTGPGISDEPTNHKFNESSSGVGLENTKNRLQQLYPNDHTINFINREEGGLKVMIDLPFEINEGGEDGN